MQGSFSIYYTEAQNWGDGSLGQVSITNNGDRSIVNWDLEFDLLSTITNIWDAEIVEHSDGHYAVEHAPWNKEIAAGETVTFSFTTDRGGSTPWNFNFDGSEFAKPSNNSNINSKSRSLASDSSPEGFYPEEASLYNTVNFVESRDNSGYYSHQGLLVTDIFGQEVISDNDDVIDSSDVDVVTGGKFGIQLN